MTAFADLVARAPLIKGDDNAAVRVLQLELKARGYALHGTGYFGAVTELALKDFQHKQSITVSGRLDMATAVALDRPFTPVPREVSIDMPPWLHKAISCIGVAEVPGQADNPVILDWARQCGGMIAREYKHDAIAWCKMFTEFCLVTTGYRGIDSLWALDNRKVGTALTGPAVGSIATKSRDGGGHTFFVAGRTKRGMIVGVGGNQGDRVSRATFDPDVLRHNWPDGFPTPAAIGLLKLPIVDDAPLSKRES